MLWLEAGCRLPVLGCELRYTVFVEDFWVGPCVGEVIAATGNLIEARIPFPQVNDG
jgi:hypothetical protein